MADEVEEENLAVWLLAIKTLRIQPFSLPSLGSYFCFCFYISLPFFLLLSTTKNHAINGTMLSSFMTFSPEKSVLILLAHQFICVVMLIRSL